MKNITRSGKCDTLSKDKSAIGDLEQEDTSKEVILLDVRNEYETKIGNFQIRDDLGNVISAATDPRTRQVRALDPLFSSFGNVTSNIVCNCCLLPIFPY